MRVERCFGDRLRTAACLLMLVTACGAPSRQGCAADAPVADAEGEALKEKIVNCIRQNYFRLQTVYCTQVTTTINPTVKEIAVLRATGDRGAVVEYTVAPRSSVETKLILAKDNLRADSFSEATNERWSVSMHDDIWTELHPGKDYARRMYREEMGGEINFDPRNIGALEQRKNFLKELRRYRVARHEKITRDGSELVVLDLSESFPEHNLTLTTRFEFNPAMNYLPVRIVGGHPETRKIQWVHDIEYQELIPRSAWFLKKRRMRFFGIEPADSVDAGGWTQELTYEIVGPVRFGDPVDDSVFKIEIPAGGNSIDQTKLHPRPAASTQDDRPFAK